MARPRTILTTLVLPAVLAFVVSGCQSHSAYHANIVATYDLRTLAADLPAGVRVPAVIAAADAALRGRGYAVTQRTASMDRGCVIARRHGSGLLEEVVVEARLTGPGTLVKIKCCPIGDEAVSRAILDAMLIRFR